MNTGGQERFVHTGLLNQRLSFFAGGLGKPALRIFFRFRRSLKPARMVGALVILPTRYATRILPVGLGHPDRRRAAGRCPAKDNLFPVG
jgi:hypothetical protein